MKLFSRSSILFVFCIYFLGVTENSLAQNFTWITGTNTPNALGLYGTQGVASTTNSPGARRGGATWTDLNGNLWLFGGEGYGQFISGYQYLNDLWKFNPNTNEWTYMKGSTLVNQPAIYGTAGTPAPGNQPGGKRYAVSWVDTAGNLWLHGGYGYYSSVSQGTNSQNDLWKYDINTNQWTFYSGCVGTGANQYGVYGTQGVASPSNISGQRMDALGWSDGSGNLWLFSGDCFGSSQFGGGVMNDLWKYSTVSNQFTWMKGSNWGNGLTVYGTQGVASPSNTPGGRYKGCSFKDAAGNFWVYGGWGYGTTNTVTGIMADLWKYTPSTNNWTWMKGPNVPGQLASYGPQGVATSSAHPGSRDMHKGWSDTAGNFWVFAGRGFGASTSFSNYMSDLWKYDVSTNQWIFMKGSSSFDLAGQYGTKGVPGSTNMPGSRNEYMCWTDLQGRLWLFGGTGYSAYSTGLLNDLWRYDVCYAPPSPTNVTSPGNLQICSGNSTTLNVTTNTGSVQWFAGASGTTALSSGYTFITPTLTSTTTFYAEGLTCGPSASRTAITVTVNPIPQVQVYGGGICTGNSFTLQPTGAMTYSYSGGSAVVSPVSTTVYTLTGTSGAGCESAPVTATVTVGNSLTVSISGNTLTCAGDAIQLLAGGGATYSWNTGAQSNTLTGAPFSGTTYTVTGYSGTCSAMAVHSVAVLPVPVIALNSGAVCAGSSFTFNLSGAATYTFLNGGPVITPATGGTYSVSGTGTNGCLSPTPAVASVTVHSLPVINSNVPVTNICEGSTLVLTATGAHTYTWTGGVSNGVAFTPTASATYSVHGTNTITGCTSAVPGIRIVSVKAAPNVSASAVPGTICAGESATLVATGASSYLWSTMATGASFVAADSVSTIYTVTGTGSNNCTKTFTLQLNVDACTGLEETGKQTSITLFPNPCRNSFTLLLSGGTAPATLVVSNIQGAIVHRQTLKDRENHISTSLANGLYFYTVTGDGPGPVTGKLIVE